MYPSFQDEWKRSPQPSAPPVPQPPPPPNDNNNYYGYGGQIAPPPPATGIPISTPSNYYVDTQTVPTPLPPPPASQFQTTTRIPGYWSTGLCDCFSDCSNCCITCWCPCITFGQIAEIVDKGSTSCGASGALYALLTYLTGCSCIYSCFYRSKLRKQYMLPESPCADCLVHCCCEPCALCQEYRELKNRGFDMSLGWHGNVEIQGPAVTTAPIAQQGMNH